MEFKVTDKEQAQVLVDALAQGIAHRRAEIALESAKINKVRFDSQAESFGPGRPSTAAANAQSEILTLFRRIERFFPVVENDPDFSKFLSNLALQTFREGGYKSELPFQEAFIDFAVSAFDLYKESGVPISIITKHSHKFSVNQIADILKDAREVFGDNKDSEPLVRTAAVQVFMKKNASIKEAKTAYDQLTSTAVSACKNERRLSDGAAGHWAKIIAKSVFTQNYKTVADAIQGYLAALTTLFHAAKRNH